jgi:hypothetical protein
MTRQNFPRSPKALLGGIAHLGRFIDKIRLRKAGHIQDYTTSQWGSINIWPIS